MCEISPEKPLSLLLLDWAGVAASPNRAVLIHIQLYNVLKRATTTT